ncbi:hypothetical protein ARSEF4850_003615 [Beauveria asiatica]
MSERRIRELERQLQQERREKEEARAREEYERREKEEAKAREEDERRKNQKTTVTEYLHNCHLLPDRATRPARPVIVVDSGTTTPQQPKNKHSQAG